MLNPVQEQFKARARELEDCATVRTTDFDDGPLHELVPDNPHAIGVSLADYGDGTCGVWFTNKTVLSEEAIYEVADVDFHIDAAVAGRVRELRGPGRASIEVDEGLGYKALDTQFESWLPIPIIGWRRRARVTQFQPYRSDGPIAGG